MQNLITELHDPLSNVMIKKLDDQSLGRFAQSSSNFFSISRLELQRRLHERARSGDIKAIIKTLSAIKESSDADLFNRLTISFKMSWTDRDNQTKKYNDTLLQLAWRMRNIRLFDCIKTFCDSLDPMLAPRQIFKNFEGAQSHWLDEYYKVMYQAGKMRAFAEFSRSTDPTTQEAEKYWQEKVGEVSLRIYHEMSWVLHLQCNSILKGFPYEFDDTFDIGQIEVKNTQNFVEQQFNNGGLGFTWAPTDTILGDSKPSTIYGVLDYAECFEYSGNHFSGLLYCVKASEKLCIAEMKGVLEQNLEIESANQTEFQLEALQLGLNL